MEIENKAISNFICNNCNYITTNKKDYNKHLLTKKHKLTLDGINFQCNKCCYITKCNQDYEKHLSSKKHKSNNGEQTNIVNDYSCKKCNKYYANRQSLWRHSKNCIYIEENEENQLDENESIVVNKNTFIELLKQNNEFKDFILEQNKEFNNRFIEQNNKIIELSQKENIVYNTTNHFNLNFFLYEKCKDAINMKEFIESIKLDFEDLEYVGCHGYIDGITKIFIDELKQLDLYKRPIHCTDLKREIIHIKEDNEWIKDNEEHTNIKKVVEYVADKNLKMLALWQKEHPESAILDSRMYNMWLNIAKHSINPMDKYDKNNMEVVRNIVKNVYINKTIENGK